MKILSLAIVALATLARAEDIEVDEGVLVLTDANFEEAIEKYDNILVEFYAPWCGHCKSLAPEYAKAAGMLDEEGSEIKLGKVDATTETELAKKFEIRGFPTLKFFVESEPIEYNGPRKAEGIVAWLKKRTGFPAEKLATVDDAKKFQDNNPVAVVGFFKDESSAEAKAYLDVVRESDEAFGFVTEQAVFDEYKVTADSAVVLLKAFDEGRNDFDGKYKKKEIKKFINDNSLPLLIEFTPEVSQKIFSGEIKYHVLYFGSKDKAEEYEKLSGLLREGAVKLRNEVLFVFVNTDVEDNSRIADFFDIKEDDYPAVRVIHLTDSLKKYRPEFTDIELEPLLEFIKNVREGNVKPHLKSESVADDWDANPVKVLCGENFDEVVFNKEKDVLVEFYAPWCGHCKKLAPIYDELGEKFEDNDAVVIAKIDSTANELEHTNIQGFPTIKLYKKGSNEVVDYNGERTLEALTKFVESGGADDDEDEDDDDDEDDDENQKDEL